MQQLRQMHAVLLTFLRSTCLHSHCRREAEDAHASLVKEHSSALEQLRAGHESEVEQLAEQMIQLEANLQRATADAEQHASTAAALQQRLEQQEDETKAAAAQASAQILLRTSQRTPSYYAIELLIISSTENLACLRRPRKNSTPSGQRQMPRRRKCIGSWKGRDETPMPLRRRRRRRRSSCAWRRGRLRPTTEHRCDVQTYD